jgi:hypothetical protein
MQWSQNPDLGELVDAGRVDLLAGQTEDDVPAIDQSGQDHAQKLRLDPKSAPVVNARFRRDQLRPTEDLSLAFLAQGIEHLLPIQLVAGF